MKDRVYEVKFNLFVSGNWIEDGLNVKTLQQRITEELPGNLCPYAQGFEIKVTEIQVKVKRSL